jgi:hypothetical protein
MFALLLATEVGAIAVRAMNGRQRLPAKFCIASFVFCQDLGLKFMATIQAVVAYQLRHIARILSPASLDVHAIRRA